MYISAIMYKPNANPADLLLNILRGKYIELAITKKSNLKFPFSSLFPKKVTTIKKIAISEPFKN